MLAGAIRQGIRWIVLSRWIGRAGRKVTDTDSARAAAAQENRQRMFLAAYADYVQLQTLSATEPANATKQQAARVQAGIAPCASSCALTLRSSSAMSRLGGAPKSRLYSRLNCDGLS